MSVRFIDINLVKNVINGVNLVKIGHFLWKLSILGHFGPQNDPIWRHRSKFWESGQKNFTLKIWKHYVSQVYWHNFGQKCHKWGQFGQNGSFWVKMVKIGSFWGQNDVIGENLGKVVKNIFFSKFRRKKLAAVCIDDFDKNCS